MKNEKIVIAGGTGFIGKYFAVAFRSAGCRVVVISRKNGDIQWNDHPGIVDAVSGASMVINLAGKSVNCRYTLDNKKEILISRVQTTEKIGRAISQAPVPPALWINSSTATIYRHAEDRPMTENTGEIGEGFSIDVATAWEKAFFNFKFPATRQVALRTAIVLGSSGGVIVPFKNIVRAGLGGKQGSGNQMFSWIHIEDLLNIVYFLKEHIDIEGVINCSSPAPVTNAALMKTLRRQLNKNFGLPAFEWMLKIGAFIIGTETELLLKSRWVLPERLIAAGFQFKYPELKDALKEIL